MVKRIEEVEDSVVRIPKCRATKETEKALLIENKDKDKIRNFWVPKSAISIEDSDVSHKRDYGTLSIYTWMYNKYLEDTSAPFWHWSER